MLKPKTLFYTSLVTAIICSIGTFLQPKNGILMVFAVYNTFNVVLTYHLWNKDEEAEKKIKIKDLSPDD